ncbi:pilin [Aliikangiella maris]|uniref:Pilin n=2 Tax=Aliikangiella maris TaxID=3162458 RepID=A0ABV3MP11_9GAMM
MINNSLTIDKGFTLIELMVVITIIAILASFAIPGYQDYILRTQVTEGISMTNFLKPRINEFYLERGMFPKNNAEAGVPEAKYFIGNYVKSIKIIDGAIHVTFGNKINQQLSDKVLTIRPQYVKENILSPVAWLCGGSSVVEGMTVSGENMTTIPNNYLPSICRH